MELACTPSSSSIVDDGVPALGANVEFGWTVSGVNSAPTLVDPADQASAEAEAISLALSATDADGDTLTWAATGLPGGLTIDTGTGAISGTVSYTAAGSHSVEITVTDGGEPSLSDEATFGWEVTATNRSPIVPDPGDQTTLEGTARH